MRSSVRATHSTSALNEAIISSVKSDMPKASLKRPSRSAYRRVQPTAIGTKNAAGSSQRVTTAPVRLLESVSTSQGLGRAAASASAASSVATVPRGRLRRCRRSASRARAG